MKLSKTVSSGRKVDRRNVGGRNTASSKKNCLLKEVSVTRKKLQNVDKSCPKMISLEKGMILTHLQKLPKNVGDLGKLMVAKGFEWLPKVQSPILVTLK